MSQADALPADPVPQNPCEQPIARWCNFMYTTRCPFAGEGRKGACKYVHLDSYVQMSREERAQLAVPDLMAKHMRGVIKELARIVEARARRVLSTWHVISMWGGAAEMDAHVCPHLDAVMALRGIGWCIPQRDDVAGQRPVDVSTSPYAEDISKILAVTARALHYDIQGAADVHFKTVGWVISLDAPRLNPEGAWWVPESQLVETDSLSMIASISTAGESDASEHLPSLLDETVRLLEETVRTVPQGREPLEMCRAGPSPTGTAQTSRDSLYAHCMTPEMATPPETPRPSRKERRAAHFKEMRKQKKLAKATRAAERQDAEQEEQVPVGEQMHPHGVRSLSSPPQQYDAQAEAIVDALTHPHGVRSLSSPPQQHDAQAEAIVDALTHPHGVRSLSSPPQQYDAQAEAIMDALTYARTASAPLLASPGDGSVWETTATATLMLV